MGLIDKKHKEFIRLVANGTNLCDAYKLISTNKKLTDGTARVNGSKLAKKYAIEIQEAKKKDVEIVDSLKDNEVLKNALNGILSQVEVDNFLCQIMLNEKTNNADKLKAIDLFYKRFGSNAPQKQQVELNNKEPIIIDWGANKDNTDNKTKGS